MKKPAYLLLSLVVLVTDQWSKWWVERNLGAFDRVEVIPGFFQLIYAENTGIAFGLFPAHGRPLGTMILAALGLGAMTLVGVLFARTPDHQPLLLVALSLVLGGALGNLTDRVLLGAVTDFLDVYWGSRHFPTFNVADSAITVGIVFLAWDSILGERSVETRETVDESTQLSA